MNARSLPLALAALLAAIALPPSAAHAWGGKGHEIANRAAAEALPDDAPAVLRRATERLVDLANEPDRWRVRDLEAMNRGWAPDHYVDLEFVSEFVDPEAPPKNRWEFIGLLVEHDVLAKHELRFDNVGYAPYRIAELCGRLETQLARLALLDDPGHPALPRASDEVRRGVEESVVFTAGVLGHYVADLANPHHCTKHFNGWKGENPKGYATDNGTHSRFESRFVERVIELDQVRPLVAAKVTPRGDYLVEAWRHAFASNALTTPLYDLDLAGAFTEGNEATPAGARGARFARERLAAGATLLRDLWMTAAARAAEAARWRRLAGRIQGTITAERLGDVFVRVGKDGTATLRGEVVSPAARDRAIAIAREQDGIRRVRSRDLRTPW